MSPEHSDVDWFEMEKAEDFINKFLIEREYSCNAEAYDLYHHEGYNIPETYFDSSFLMIAKDMEQKNKARIDDSFWNSKGRREIFVKKVTQKMSNLSQDSEKYVAEDLAHKPILWSCPGWQLVRDSRGVKLGRTEQGIFIPFP